MNGRVLGTFPASVVGNISTTDMLQLGRHVLRFEASRSYVKVMNPSACATNPDLCTAGLTVSLVTKFDDAAKTWTANTFIVDSIEDEPLRRNRGFAVYVINGELRVSVFTQKGSWSAKVQLRTGVWQHVMFTWQVNNGLFLYIDGTQR